MLGQRSSCKEYSLQIGELRQLRMLALAGNKLAVLPESISMLTNLQVCSRNYSNDMQW
jgi:hypothetical protein